MTMVTTDINNYLVGILCFWEVCNNACQKKLSAIAAHSQDFLQTDFNLLNCKPLSVNLFLFVRAFFHF